jgi:rhodanese-related sulfurtransferase
MKPTEVQDAVANGAVVLDMRPPKPFATEHVPGAVNFQFNRADLAERAEMSLPQDLTYIIHAEPDPIAKVAIGILSKAGFLVDGYLEGGLKQWKADGLPTEALPLLTVDELKDSLDRYHVVDTREGFEFRFGHIPGSICLEWTEPWDQMEGLESERPLALVCGDQVRSAYVASVMQRAKMDAALVFGGMVDWLERGYPVEKSPKKAKTPTT